MKKRSGWSFFVALRFFYARKENGARASSVLASLGIAIGTATLIVVISVMNGFQSGFIDSILEVDSHHIRISSAAGANPYGDMNALAAKLRNDPRVLSALPFSDYETVALGKSGRSLPLRIKALPDDAADADPAMVAKLSLQDGAFVASKQNGVIIGAELARQLDLYPGDEISLLSVGASETEGVTAKTVRLPVLDVFRSGYYNFDNGLGFVSFRTAEALGGPAKIVLGIKLRDMYDDERFARRLVDVYGVASGQIVTWREYNRSFFGALRMEKTAMMILIGLIFVVVAVNIFHSMRKTVFEKMEDIAVLKTLGGSASAVRRVFVLDGMAIGLIGSVCGMVVGLAIAININEFFSAIEAIVNAILYVWNVVRFHSGGGGDFKVFSPTYFYLLRVPSKILFSETLFIFSAGVASAAISAWAASRRVLRFRPAEVLRNE
jgi:lipoprotein-releasing system permease protein